MSMLRKFLLFLFVLILLGVLLAYFTGNTHVLTGIRHTYLKGRTGPAPDEFPSFPSRKIDAGAPAPYPLSATYNRSNIPEDLLPSVEALDPLAFLVIHRDSLLFEKYWEQRKPEDLSNSFSMAKTIVSILAGIAIHEGKIPSLDVPVLTYLPNLKGPYARQLTLRHLLNMSSGIDFDEDYISPFAYPAKAYYGTDIRKLTLGYSCEHPPGREFIYLSGNTELAALVIEKATGMSLSSYASEKLWKPIGAEAAASWSTDVEDGMEKAYCCVNSNARDFAKLGTLYLHQGYSNGRQLIDSAYVAESILPAKLQDAGNQKLIDRYGLSWWLCTHRGKNVFYARGILGQYIMVMPDEQLVAVRLGRKRLKEKRNDHPQDLFTYLDLALTIAGK